MKRLCGLMVLASIGAEMALVSCDQATLQRVFSADSKASRWDGTSPSPSMSAPTVSPQEIQPSTKPTPSSVPKTETKPMAAATPALQQVPSALQPYVQAVEALQALTIKTPVQPNQPISRAQFARWLVELNNRLYRDRPARQIRLAVSSQPAFEDVPQTHPDFAFIQGLAESGYLPSPLSGDKTQARFRPQDPLTRETLLLWKVPVDRQQILPAVSVARVKQLWGFKDANRITPAALSAVAADYQNGDLSNIRRILGSTLLLQPQKAVTQAEAIAALWFIGIEGESLSVQDLLRAERSQWTVPNAAVPEDKTKAVGPQPQSEPLW